VRSGYSQASQERGAADSGVPGSEAAGVVTYEQAINLKSFQHHCQCGGYAWNFNGRDEEQPHMSWCPQFDEYAEWRAALKQGQSGGVSCG
jgi:hypothetical protein